MVFPLSVELDLDFILVLFEFLHQLIFVLVDETAGSGDGLAIISSVLGLASLALLLRTSFHQHFEVTVLGRLWLLNGGKLLQFRIILCGHLLVRVQLYLYLGHLDGALSH